MVTFTSPAFLRFRTRNANEHKHDFNLQDVSALKSGALHFRDPSFLRWPRLNVSGHGVCGSTIGFGRIVQSTSGVGVLTGGVRLLPGGLGLVSSSIGLLQGGVGVPPGGVRLLSGGVGLLSGVLGLLLVVVVLFPRVLVYASLALRTASTAEENMPLRLNWVKSLFERPFRFRFFFDDLP